MGKLSPHCCSLPPPTSHTHTVNSRPPLSIFLFSLLDISNGQTDSLLFSLSSFNTKVAANVVTFWVWFVMEKFWECVKQPGTFYQIQYLLNNVYPSWGIVQLSWYLSPLLNLELTPCPSNHFTICIPYFLNIHLLCNPLLYLPHTIPLNPSPPLLLHPSFSLCVSEQ